MKSIKVPLKQLDDIRKILMKNRIMNMDYKIKTLKDYGYIAITEENELTKKFQIVDIDMEKIKKYPHKFTDLLKNKLNKDEIENLKKSFDIIGDIVIVEIPENLENKKLDIGKATLDFTKRKSVYMKKSPVKGKTRIRDLELISGISNPITIHKEYGTKLKLNIEEVYFSPRLATERKRVADLVKDHENILDMFCGIGPFPIVIAKNKEVNIVGVDINKKAIEYLKINTEKNKLKGEILGICGDIVTVSNNQLKNKKFNRIIMNLPGKAYEFLDIAMNLIENNGVIHYYEFSDDYIHGIDCLKKVAKKENKVIEITNTRKVKSSSPGMWHVSIDCLIKDQ